MTFQVFHLVDLIVLDGLLYHFVHPAFMRFEGVSKLGFLQHLRDAGSGVIIGALVALLVASVASLLIAFGLVDNAGA